MLELEGFVLEVGDSRQREEHGEAERRDGDGAVEQAHVLPAALLVLLGGEVDLQDHGALDAAQRLLAALGHGALRARVQAVEVPHDAAQHQPLRDRALVVDEQQQLVHERGARLRRQLVAFVQMLREEDLKKLPASSETIDWARVLLLLHADALEADLVRDTLNVLLKFEQDIAAVERSVAELTRKAKQA